MMSSQWKVFAAIAMIGLAVTTAGVVGCSADSPKATEEAGQTTAPLPETASTPAPILQPPVAKPETEGAEITLTVGKPAPPLTVTSWIKGEPLEGLKPGQVYVVEFWATWCPPCLAGMPHLSELQTQYGDKVRFIGVSDEKEDVVTEWLKTEREAGVTWDQTVTYSLAMDGKNVMNETYFRAAGRTGIPSAFVVGKDGIIEWIGHPAQIEEPLAKVTDGTWDRKAARLAYDVELKQMKLEADRRAIQAKARKVQLAIAAAVRAKDWEKASALIEEQIEKTPDNLSLQLAKLSVLSQSEKADEATALVEELVKKDWDQGTILGPLAVGIATKHFPGTLDEAERIAKHALELAGDKSVSHIHALARVYAEKGQIDDAITWERKALELAENNVVILQTLREYEDKKDAAEKGAEGVKPEKSETP